MAEEQRDIIKPPYGPPRRNNPRQNMSPMPPQGPSMPIGGMPGQAMPPRPKGWRQRFMRNYGLGDYGVFNQTDSIVPNWLTDKAMVFFFISLFACFIFLGHIPKFDLLLTASVSTILFFYGCSTMSKSWAHASEKRFLRNVFWTGFAVRIVWILYCYFFFNPEYYGNNYGTTADVDWYMPFAKDLAGWLAGDSRYTLSKIIDINGSAIDDVGYPMWLAVEYFLTGRFSDVFVPFVIKCIVSAYCAISIYHIAKRHFGVGTARMVALFVCLNPNMIYWSGNMFKEAEMVFLCCVSVDNLDRVLSSGNKLTFKALFPGLLAGISLFFFRTALGLTVFLAVFAHVVMASRRVMSTGKKVLAGVLVAAVLAVGIGDRLLSQSRDLLDASQSDYQSKNMEWRSEREGGNDFAKYAGAAVFAPLIFTLPFPTFNEANEGQLLQIQTSGGSYIKNILSFFVIVVMILLLASGEWRKHVFILAYTVGYLVVLVMSAFAQSGRFHMPIWPMLMLFSAYGVQLAKGNVKLRRGYVLVLVAEIFICLAWNWFKLKGRGMI